MIEVLLDSLFLGTFIFFLSVSYFRHSSVSYRNFLHSNEQLIVIARSVVTKQSYNKWRGIELKIIKNEIATPFGLAMTVILGMRIYGTRH